MDESNEWMAKTVLEILQVYPVFHIDCVRDHMMSAMRAPNEGAHRILTSHFPQELKARTQVQAQGGGSMQCCRQRAHRSVLTVLKAYQAKGWDQARRNGAVETMQGLPAKETSWKGKKGKASKGR